MDYSKFALKFSVAKATQEKIVLSHLDEAKEKLDGAKEFSVAQSTENFHVIFESELVSDGCSGALDDH